MKAVRIERFGSPEVIVLQDIPVPSPGRGEVLVQVAAAGVGPWDALIREGKSKVSPQPPLTLGSDLSGKVVALGPDVAGLSPGDHVYGVTNASFCGAQAEYAVAQTGMVAPRPAALNDVEAASAPVIAVTAWQMLFEHAMAKRGDEVLVTGAGGNVGAYAVQLAVQAGIRVVAVARSKDEALVRSLGAEEVIDLDSGASLPEVDALLDTVGSGVVERCATAVRRGGKLVSVAAIDPPRREGVLSVFFYAEVTAARLALITELFESGKIASRVGEVLPLAEARRAHEMLAGAPHETGKIVLRIQGLLTR